jgi:HK97 family phage major capsid protein
MNMIEMKRTRAEALAKAEVILTTAEQRGGAMTASEQENYRASMSEFEALSCSISAREKVNTVKNLLGNGANILLGTPDADAPAVGSPLALAAARKPEYTKALHAFLKAGGKVHTDELLSGADGEGGFVIPGSEAYTRQRLANGSFPKMTAATYEGSQGSSDGAGGYAISVPTSQLIVPLAMPDLGIFDAATVIPTDTDIKVPQQSAFGTSAQKAESTGTIATFGGTDPALSQTTLTAFMVGALRLASWELLQDVKTFQEFIVDDLIKGQRILEGSLLASGNGTTQPLGVFGNTGGGVGSPYELLGTSADSLTLLNSLFDVTALLKGVYQPNAAWIMSRATGLAIRRAQMQANLFAPVVTMDPDGTERILGRPVFFDLNAPALPTATSAGVVPILYGDFKAGYLIGVRGGAGINVKVLDQPWAAQGQLGILAYRRLDGRVRRSEAMQAITISHS